MIKIILDKELDKETFLNFFDFKVGGVDFGKNIKENCPNISSKNYQEYIDNYYKKNKKELENSLLEIEELTQEQQKDFFNVVQEIFKQDFSPKKYLGALSIFDCNPRYLDKNIFQVYYKRSNSGKLEVIFHEVLHFIFFDYCDKNLKDLVSGLDKNNGTYWDLSEIFNTIILNLPSFQVILKQPELIFYPNHKEIYPTIERIWRDSKGDIRNFVEKSLEALRVN